MRKFSWRLLVLAALGLPLANLILPSGVVRAQEEAVPLDKLPKAIVASVKKRFPDAEMVKAGKETAEGKTVYEVSLKKKGRKIDVSLSSEGQIQSIEREIGIQDLPKIVADAFKSKYAKAKLNLIEEVIHVKEGKESLDYYEFQLVTTDNQTIEVIITPAGKINPEPKK